MQYLACDTWQNHPGTSEWFYAVFYGGTAMALSIDMIPLLTSYICKQIFKNEHTTRQCTVQ